MANYGDLQSRIADDLNRSDLGDQIKREIRRAIVHYTPYRLRFNETARVVTTTASQGYLTSSLSDMIALDELFITISSHDVRMTPRSLVDIVEGRPSSTGTPTSYCLYQNRVELDILPSGTFSITAYIHYELPELSADSDENGWTNEGQDLIVARAEKVLYAQVLKDQQKAVIAGQLEREALAALKSRSNRRTGTGQAKCYL